jgi:hypothetical protein
MLVKTDEIELRTASRPSQKWFLLQLHLVPRTTLLLLEWAIWRLRLGWRAAFCSDEYQMVKLPSKPVFFSAKDFFVIPLCSIVLLLLSDRKFLQIFLFSFPFMLWFGTERIVLYPLYISFRIHKRCCRRSPLIPVSHFLMWPLYVA